MATPRLPRGAYLAHNIFSLLFRFHAGHHDAAGSHIQNARKRRVSCIGNARDGDDVAATAGCNHLREQPDIATPMFHIEDHEIQSAGGQHRADAGSKEFQNHLP
jgi:hypothetical protein